MMETRVPRYARYLSADGSSVYNYVDFCPSCRRALNGSYGSPYGFPYLPEDLETESWHSFSGGLGERTVEYFAFCPWCGTSLPDGWWRDQIVDNERAIDHYAQPGTHKGDTHEFGGSDLNEAVAGHWLGTNGEKLCWCAYEVEPGLMGCVIRHAERSDPRNDA